MYDFIRRHPTTFIVIGFIILLFIFVRFFIDVTTYILLAGLLAYICMPVVVFLTKRKINRNLVIFIIFIFVIAIFMVIFSSLIPKLITQIVQFINELPALYDDIVKLIDEHNFNLLDKFDLGETLIQYRSNIVQITSFLLSLISQKAQGFGFSLIFIPLLFFYFLRDYERFPGLIDIIFPKSRVSEVKAFFAEYNTILASYFRGQVIIAIMVAISTWIIFSLLEINFAMIIALLGGLLNFVPVLGPLIAAIPAILLALLKSPLTALLVGVILFLVNQITSVVIFPTLISKRVKLSPIVIVISVLAAANISGIIGILLVLPIVILIKLFWVKYVRPELDEL